jgi:hypothetical protein
VSLLRPSNIDKRAAYDHQESKGPLSNATSKSTLAAQEMAKPLTLSDHNTQMLHSMYFIETQNVDYLFRSITPELETIAIAGDTLFGDCTRDGREANHRHHSFGRSLMPVGDKFVAEIGADCYRSGRTCRRYFKELSETVTAWKTPLKENLE